MMRSGIFDLLLSELSVQAVDFVDSNKNIYWFLLVEVLNAMRVDLSRSGCAPGSD